MKKINLKKGDKVIILSGRDKGKTGIVDHVFTKTGMILVEGANLVKKHVKVSQKFPQGGVVEIPKAISAGKVQLVCPNCDKVTRVSVITTGKEKGRVCKKCQKPIASTKQVKEKK